MVLAPVLFAQGQTKGRGRGGKSADPAVSVPHDPHDLNGVWSRSGGVLTMSNETPPMTAWGLAKFNANHPVYGPRAVPGGNDPMSTCGPLGMPRNISGSVDLPHGAGSDPEPDLSVLEWAHSYRVIWTDGRELPKDPDPHWMGYSVGKWEGDAFVVKSTGFDDRTWLGHFGNPVSEDMSLRSDTTAWTAIRSNST
jgi:hypothetical protein